MPITLNIDSWKEEPEAGHRLRILDDLEAGNVILLPRLEFTLLAEEKKFLTEDCADPKSKHLSFDPQTSILRGSRCTGDELTQLRTMVSRFASQAHQLVESLFPHYKEPLQWGRTSFRPFDAAGRKAASCRKDDTRLHVDAFASKPVQGLRLLRIFANINPHLPRVWKLGEPFEAVATRFLPRIRHKPWIHPRILQKIGITKGLRSPYDHLMLQIHDAMKRDVAYQNTAPQREVALPSGSAWIVMTDHVSHAALSGQFLLEQTFYLPVEAMKSPDQSPLRILERMVGKNSFFNDSPLARHLLNFHGRHSFVT